MPAEGSSRTEAPHRLERNSSLCTHTQIGVHLPTSCLLTIAVISMNVCPAAPHSTDAGAASATADSTAVARNQAAACAAHGKPAPAGGGPAPLQPETLVCDGWFAERQVMWPGEAKCLQVRRVLEHRASKFQVCVRTACAGCLLHNRVAPPAPCPCHRISLCLTARHTAGCSSWTVSSKSPSEMSVLTRRCWRTCRSWHFVAPRNGSLSWAVATVVSCVRC